MEHGNCIGCQACVDACPFRALSFHYDEWGEGKAAADETKCKKCGLCERICPAEKISFNKPVQTVYAVISKKNRNTGSSGGVFFELASDFIEQGGVVYGAAFNRDLKLVHKKAQTVDELSELCKSKYFHSDMTGIYSEIHEFLKANRSVMFVGTPCQVSAVKNLFSQKYGDMLFCVDFLCHGAGTQKIFDICIKEEEKKRNGKITDFSFRAKTRKAEHSFRYTLKCGEKSKEISGYSFEFPYYNAYLKYNIFCECCYNCKYARADRVGDITLGDFWRIQKFNKSLRDKDGVSAICVNTAVGQSHFDKIKSNCIVYEYPIEVATDNNPSLKKCVGEAAHQSKHRLLNVLHENGESVLYKELRCDNVNKELLYAKTPDIVKKIWNHIRGIK